MFNKITNENVYYNQLEIKPGEFHLISDKNANETWYLVFQIMFHELTLEQRNAIVNIINETFPTVEKRTWKK